VPEEALAAPVGVAAAPCWPVVLDEVVSAAVVLEGALDCAAALAGAAAEDDVVLVGAAAADVVLDVALAGALALVGDVVLAASPPLGVAVPEPAFADAKAVR
jgi:hypothetical protein